MGTDSLNDLDENRAEAGYHPPPVSAGVPAGAKAVTFLSALLLLVMAAAGGLWRGAEMAAAVLISGLVAIGNFWLLARIVVKTTSRDDAGVGALVGPLLAKFGLLGVSLGLLALVFRMDPMGLLLGVGVVFPAIILHTVAEQLR